MQDARRRRIGTEMTANRHCLVVPSFVGGNVLKASVGVSIFCAANCVVHDVAQTKFGSGFSGGLQVPNAKCHPRLELKRWRDPRRVVECHCRLGRRTWLEQHTSTIGERE